MENIPFRDAYFINSLEKKYGLNSIQEKNGLFYLTDESIKKTKEIENLIITNNDTKDPVNNSNAIKNIE